MSLGVIASTKELSSEELGKVVTGDTSFVDRESSHESGDTMDCGKKVSPKRLPDKLIQFWSQPHHSGSTVSFVQSDKSGPSKSGNSMTSSVYSSASSSCIRSLEISPYAEQYSASAMVNDNSLSMDCSNSRSSHSSSPDRMEVDLGTFSSLHNLFSNGHTVERNVLTPRRQPKSNSAGTTGSSSPTYKTRQTALVASNGTDTEDGVVRDISTSVRTDVGQFQTSPKLTELIKVWNTPHTSGTTVSFNQSFKNCSVSNDSGTSISDLQRTTPSSRKVVETTSANYDTSSSMTDSRDPNNTASSYERCHTADSYERSRTTDGSTMSATISSNDLPRRTSHTNTNTSMTDRNNTSSVNEGTAAHRIASSLTGLSVNAGNRSSPISSHSPSTPDSRKSWASEKSNKFDSSNRANKASPDTRKSSFIDAIEIFSSGSHRCAVVPPDLSNSMQTLNASAGDGVEMTLQLEGHGEKNAGKIVDDSFLGKRDKMNLSTDESCKTAKRNKEPPSPVRLSGVIGGSSPKLTSGRTQVSSTSSSSRMQNSSRRVTFHEASRECRVADVSMSDASRSEDSSSDPSRYESSSLMMSNSILSSDSATHADSSADRSVQSSDGQLDMSSASKSSLSRAVVGSVNGISIDSTKKSQANTDVVSSVVVNDIPMKSSLNTTSSPNEYVPKSMHEVIKCAQSYRGNNHCHSSGSPSRNLTLFCLRNSLEFRNRHNTNAESTLICNIETSSSVGNGIRSASQDSLEMRQGNSSPLRGTEVEREKASHHMHGDHCPSDVTCIGHGSSNDVHKKLDTTSESFYTPEHSRESSSDAVASASSKGINTPSRIENLDSFLNEAYQARKGSAERPFSPETEPMPDDLDITSIHSEGSDGVSVGNRHHLVSLDDDDHCLDDVDSLNGLAILTNGPTIEGDEAARQSSTSFELGCSNEYNHSNDTEHMLANVINAAQLAVSKQHLEPDQVDYATGKLNDYWASQSGELRTANSIVSTNGDDDGTCVHTNPDTTVSSKELKRLSRRITPLRSNSRTHGGSQGHDAIQSEPKLKKPHAKSETASLDCRSPVSRSSSRTSTARRRHPDSMVTNEINESFEVSSVSTLGNDSDKEDGPLHFWIDTFLDFVSPPDDDHSVNSDDSTSTTTESVACARNDAEEGTNNTGTVGNVALKKPPRAKPRKRSQSSFQRLREWWKKELIAEVMRDTAKKADVENDAKKKRGSSANVERMVSKEFKKVLSGERVELIGSMDSSDGEGLNTRDRSQAPSESLPQDWLESMKTNVVCGTADTLKESYRTIQKEVESFDTLDGLVQTLKKTNLDSDAAAIRGKFKSIYSKIQLGIQEAKLFDQQSRENQISEIRSALLTTQAPGMSEPGLSSIPEMAEQRQLANEITHSNSPPSKTIEEMGTKRSIVNVRPDDSLELFLNEESNRARPDESKVPSFESPDAREAKANPSYETPENSLIEHSLNESRSTSSAVPNSSHVMSQTTDAGEDTMSPKNQTGSENEPSSNNDSIHIDQGKLDLCGLQLGALSVEYNDLEPSSLLHFQEPGHNKSEISASIDLENASEVDAGASFGYSRSDSTTGATPSEAFLSHSPIGDDHPQESFVQWTTANSELDIDMQQPSQSHELSPNKGNVTKDTLPDTSGESINTSKLEFVQVKRLKESPVDSESSPVPVRAKKRRSPKIHITTLSQPKTEDVGSATEDGSVADVSEHLDVSFPTEVEKTGWSDTSESNLTHFGEECPLPALPLADNFAQDSDAIEITQGIAPLLGATVFPTATSQDTGTQANPRPADTVKPAPPRLLKNVGSVPFLKKRLEMKARMKAKSHADDSAGEARASISAAPVSLIQSPSCALILDNVGESQQSRAAEVVATGSDTLDVMIMEHMTMDEIVKKQGSTKQESLMAVKPSIIGHEPCKTRVESLLQGVELPRMRSFPQSMPLKESQESMSQRTKDAGDSLGCQILGRNRSDPGGKELTSLSVYRAKARRRLMAAAKKKSPEEALSDLARDEEKSNGPQDSSFEWVDFSSQTFGVNFFTNNNPNPVNSAVQANTERSQKQKSESDNTPFKLGALDVYTNGRSEFATFGENIYAKSVLEETNWTNEV